MFRRPRAPLPFIALIWLAPVAAHAGETVTSVESETPNGDGKVEDEGQVIITAARTVLPPNALPLTIDVIDKAALDQQLAISGSVTDAVATLTPSFSPTRQKLSGA